MCFLILFTEGNINLIQQQAHMFRLYITLINCVSAILSENQPSGAQRQNCLEREGESNKSKDGHICQKTKNICVCGGRRSFFHKEALVQLCFEEITPSHNSQVVHSTRQNPGKSARAWAVRG